MPTSPGKFRGPSVQPVGAGRARAQQPGASGSAKKTTAQLTDLEQTKANRDVGIIFLTVDNTPYSVGLSDEVIIGNTNGGAIDIHLPLVAERPGRLLTIKKWSISVNPLTLLPATGDTVEQGASRFMNGADKAVVQLRADKERKDWVFVASFGTVV